MNTNMSGKRKALQFPNIVTHFV